MTTTARLLSAAALLLTLAPSLCHAAAPPAAPMEHVAWSRNANIYEVNLRQFSQEGTIKAFAAQLPRLKKMGVDILWIMPVQPIGQKERKGTLGSYYAVKDYTAVNPYRYTQLSHAPRALTVTRWPHPLPAAIPARSS